MTKSLTIGAYAVLVFQHQGMPLTEVRAELIDSGVAKGTTSKIITVLKGLEDGTISREQVTSLNRAYTLIKHGNRPSSKAWAQIREQASILNDVLIAENDLKAVISRAETLVRLISKASK